MITVELTEIEVSQLLTVLDIVRHRVAMGRMAFPDDAAQAEVGMALEMLWLKIGDAAIGGSP